MKIEDVGFKAADDYTLVCELENYLPYFLQYVKFEVMAPVYEPFYTEVGADLFGTAPEYICYNGPFYMSEWVLENSISCPKNESYWDADKVSLAGIKWVKYTDYQREVQRLRRRRAGCARPDRRAARHAGGRRL